MPAATARRVQQGLEALYRVDTGVEIDDFLVGAELRDALVAARRPREQLLVCETPGDSAGDGDTANELAIALFIDPGALANLSSHDPSRRLGDHNLGDFLLVVEGVSHFIYAIRCARAGRPVSQLELELQAEVDKYVTCLLVTEPAAEVSELLRRRLFGDPDYDPDLDGDEHARYRSANDNAHRYAAWLEQAFVAPRRIPEMLGELRRFYRLGLAAKLGAIARAS